jgi:hypothetical protein
MTVYWVTDEPWPTSDKVLAEAEAASADVILHGVPVSLSEHIPTETRGVYEVELVADEPQADPMTAFLAAILAAESIDQVRDAAQSALKSIGGAE